MYRSSLARYLTRGLGEGSRAPPRTKWVSVATCDCPWAELARRRPIAAVRCRVRRLLRILLNLATLVCLALAWRRYALGEELPLFRSVWDAEPTREPSFLRLPARRNPRSQVWTTLPADAAESGLSLGWIASRLEVRSGRPAILLQLAIARWPPDADVIRSSASTHDRQPGRPPPSEHPPPLGASPSSRSPSHRPRPPLAARHRIAKQATGPT